MGKKSARADGRPKNTDTIDTSANNALGHRQTPFRPPNAPCRVLSPLPYDSSAFVKILLQPDMHVPYHNPRAPELLYRVAEHTKPDVLVVLGDHFDFFAVSDHQKDPKQRMDMAWEIAEGDKVLQGYDNLGVFKRKIFCEGNHEQRLTRYVANKGGDVYRMLAPAGLIEAHSLPKVLGLRERGWEWIPYKDFGRIGGLHFTHDVDRAGKTAHENAQADFETSSIIGHTHQLRLMVRGNAHGKWHTGAMVGWLGDWRQIEYRAKMKIKREWPLGFGMAYVEKATDAVHLQPVLVHDNGRKLSALVEGKLFRSN